MINKIIGSRNSCNINSFENDKGILSLKYMGFFAPKILQ